MKISSEMPGAPVLFEYLRMERVRFADLLEPVFCSNTPLEPGLPGDSSRNSSVQVDSWMDDHLFQCRDLAILVRVFIFKGAGRPDTPL